MITVIHNTYRYNPLIRESVILNLLALKKAKVEYQYIVFNDNGDKDIENLVEGLDVEYHYSSTNYGKKMCSGGWVGAIPLIKGDYIHNTGQDDVFTSNFYTSILSTFRLSGCDLVYCNGFKVREDLTATGDLLGGLTNTWNYERPREVFNYWLGVEDKRVTRANNYIPAPGVIYRAGLHNEIGTPDIETFRGVADFEYWVRLLYYSKKIQYIANPLWFYRLSQYTTTLEVIDGKLNERDLSTYYLDKLKQKYQNLIDNE